ncbi:hypothetical protein AVEN_205178-1, partial [Araneus ventricosus]
MALQETLLSPAIEAKIKNYNIIRKDNLQNERSVGGVAILYLQNLPSKPVHLNTTLQAVAVQVRIKTLTTVCSIYLPPSQTIQQSELDALVRQLPPPFIILGDWNGHSSFWGSTDSNARGLQIE